MSRTFKFTLAATLAFSVITTTVQAQNAQDGNAQALAALMQSMAAGTASSDDIGNEIENRIRTIMTEMQTSPTREASRPVTIEEIDRINRAAERERTELEFEKARTERSQLEIQRLLALYEAVKSIEEDKKKESEAIQDRMMLLAEQAGGEEKPDPEAGAISRDQKNLPRIDSISGIGGVFSAEAEFGDTMKTLHEGDRALNGFTVETIESDSVVLRGASGRLFRIYPQAPVPPAPPMQSGPGGVIDLSRFPMAQF